MNIHRVLGSQKVAMRLKLAYQIPKNPTRKPQRYEIGGVKFTDWRFPEFYPYSDILDKDAKELTENEIAFLNAIVEHLQKILDNIEEHHGDKYGDNYDGSHKNKIMTELTRIKDKISEYENSKGLRNS